MPLELLDHCTFNGPALPEPFVRFELEKELSRLNLPPKNTGAEGKQLQVSWDSYRRALRELAVRGGPLRVRHCVLDPLVERLGFARSEAVPDVETREGHEDGGFLFVAPSGAKLRTWATEFEEDLDAPARRGAAYRFSHLRIAQRVLLASSERVGLLTNGVQLRLLISDPARPDSEVVIPLESGWKRSRDLPDSFRFLLALCQPAGIAAVPEIVEKARLQQARVTKDLRLQAREAVERFVQEVLDHPANATELQNYPDQMKLARDLWHEGLVLVYRLLFILKLESTDDPARSFSFTSSSLWRNTFSPGVALAGRVRDVLDHGEETGRYLEDALHNLFRMFAEAIEEGAINSWGLSLGYSLLIGMQRLFVLDTSELEFKLEGPWKLGNHKQVALAFIDPSLGGTGYLGRIADEFHLVAQRALEHLDHPNCETACYRCLKSYQNQRNHEHLRWPLVIPHLQALSVSAPAQRPPETGDLDDPKPWLEAYSNGVGSPLELQFLRLFEKHGFHPEKQVPVSPTIGGAPISVADFAVAGRRLAIYIDGAAFHVGKNLRRDRYIRDKLRNGQPPWRVEELTVKDLAGGEALVKRLGS